MLKADLHIHSSVSDGSATIAEIIEQALSKGLDAIAITDHDTFSHISQTPSGAPITIIPGLEMSAIEKNSRIHVHVLGYNIQSPEIVEALTQPLLESRHRNTHRQIEILKTHGFAIDISRLKPADGKYLYKQHVLAYLVNTGQIKDMRTTFKNHGSCHFDIAYIDARDAVKAIVNAGGLAVLAHAGQQQNFHLIPELVACGLSGLELNHPSNSAQDQLILKDYATRYGLFLTGGSDYHGKYAHTGISIGDFISETSGLRAIVIR